MEEVRPFYYREALDLNYRKGGFIMPITKAQMRVTAKYQKANYDEIKVRTAKGEKEKIKEHATAQGETVNTFINRAISETIKRDNANTDSDQ